MAKKPAAAAGSKVEDMRTAAYVVAIRRISNVYNSLGL